MSIDEIIEFLISKMGVCPLGTEGVYAACAMRMGFIDEEEAHAIEFCLCIRAFVPSYN
jgi:hypothetical protein